MEPSRRAAERSCEVSSQLNLQSPRVPGQFHHQTYMSSGAKTDEINYEILVAGLGHRLLGYASIRAMF